MDTYAQVAESLRIEGIDRPPTDDEIAEHLRFMRLKMLSISELEAFLKIYSPGARLRMYPGQDVCVCLTSLRRAASTSWRNSRLCSRRSIYGI
jgi:hypothetical protein